MATGNAKLLQAALMAMGTLCGAAESFARGVIVSPTQLGLSGAPGQAVSGTILVASSRQETNQVRVTLGDFMRDINGNLVSEDRKDHPRSCREWLVVDQGSFTSPETGRVEVVVTAKIPKDATGSYWAVLRVDSLPPPRTGDQIRLAIMPRVAIPVIVTVAGTEKLDVRVTEIRASQPKEGEVIECDSLIENRGNAAVLVSGAFALEQAAAGSDEPEEVGSVAVGPVTSLPGTKMHVRGKIPWRGSSAGLQVHGYFRYGPNSADTAEAVTAIEDLSTTPRPASPAQRLAPGGEKKPEER